MALGLPGCVFSGSCVLRELVGRRGSPWKSSLPAFSATLAPLREISPFPASSSADMKFRHDYRMDGMGIGRENILFISFILSDLTFWPAIEASNDLCLPDRDRPKALPRSVRENPLLYPFHFTPSSNTSAIGLLDLPTLPPGRSLRDPGPGQPPSS
jgi:hypothetical protein